MAMVEPIHTNMSRPPMTTDALTLAQWLSPAYPIGAFAYSHGLEAAIQSDAICSAAHLEVWLSDLIDHGSGRNDCILLYAAHAADTSDHLSEINDTGLALAASSERILETSAQGTAFCKVTSDIWGGDAASYIYPVAIGAAAARMSINRQLAASMYLHANVGNLATAAQRLMGLGQTHAQSIVAALAPLCEDTAAHTMVKSLDDLQSTAFLSDIAAMQHETLPHRIFRT